MIRRALSTRTARARRGFRVPAPAAGVLIAVAAIVAASASQDARPRPGRGLPLDTIKLPPGFRIDLFAADVPGARTLARADNGLVFAGTMREGAVYALTPSGDGTRAARVDVVAKGLSLPNGVAARGGDLYVAEETRLLRYRGIASKPSNAPAPEVLFAGFPRQPGHGWRHIGFGPDGRLYVSIGAPCNICDPGDPYASIARMAEDFSGFEIFARGVRDSQGFDWQPGAGVLWFTDNGRDGLGDDVPPDELDRAPAAGLNFGYPFCYGRGTPDPKFPGRDCAGFVPPAAELPAHVAPLGMRFYTGSRFPREYRGGVFIAEHGSWNRSTPIGYRVTTAAVAGDRADNYRVFAEGWLRGGTPWGRPVDVLVMPDGALLVSDDLAGVVYRIAYEGGG